MAKTKLFDSYTYKLTLPAPFDSPNCTGAKSFGFSRYNTVSVQKATLHAPTLRALLAYAKLVHETDAGHSVQGLGAVGQQGTTYRIAEYVSANKTDMVAFNQNTGKFYTARVKDGDTMLNSYVLGPGSGMGSGSALIFCLIPLLLEESEFEGCFNEFLTEMADGWTDMDKALNTALILCDNVYRRIENAKNLGADGIRLVIPATGNLATITQMALDNGNYSPTGVLYGEFNIFPMTGCVSPVSIAAITPAELAGKYKLSARMLSAREQAMVPKLPDWYIVPREVVRVCEHAMSTTGASQPMRNFMFRGVAGTGKTMSAQAIAAGLNLPYTLMTCNANTEITDLIGQFIPDAPDQHSSRAHVKELPKVSDITMHPPSVYQILTGEYDDDKTEDDVLQKLIEIAVEQLTPANEQGQRIRYVDSPLIEAIRYGYVCELQEPSCIANPGVLVGLNSLLDNCQVITLPTGERIERHPDTVLIVTTNSDYAGCRDMNQSIISRMDLLYDIEAPELTTMVKRVMNITGFADEQTATKMAIVVRNMAERCRQTMITDGSCGMRELKSWIQSTMVTNDPYESALSTIISSASADPDNREDLISSCLQAQFSER